MPVLILRNGPNTRLSSLMYVLFAVAFAECGVAAERSGRPTNTTLPNVNVEVTRTTLLHLRLYCCLMARMCVSDLYCSA